jgi:serine/threonine protein kinase/tetratricopeptide (TPR) repeat protein
LDPNEQTIFDAARQISDAESLALYLEQACAGNVALRKRLEKLLQASRRADDFLAINPLALNEALRPTLLVDPPSEAPGTIIGNYKLLEKLGEGGFGVVYMAEQKQPIRRRVALKIIKVGMDTREVVARFEAERQALALMDHPNIAKVHDAGATATGRPYFVMELVRGLKITDYCDEKRLSTRERLDLFTHVCQAVQHAHQKGIIHRDLKPSNILVTVNDGIAVPKIIDFGIAKATQMELTEKTVFTRFHQFIGTPAYMSPEQTEITSVDVDTRSDIYSLGVLLYELLTGTTPFDTRELLKAGLDEMRRTIRETEPARPSTRVSTLGAEELTTAAKRRGLEAPKLISALRGDLDWIVMKCLEKDRARRYETANGLASDIQRHLNNEPVVACPPSNLYKFQKLVQRNKVAFGAGAGIAVALVIGLAVALWQSIEKSRAYNRAIVAESEARAVLRFFEERVLRSPQSGRPGMRDAKQLGSGVKVSAAIDAAEASIANSFSNQPLVEASIRSVIGGTYRDLGQHTKAIKQHGRALELRRQHAGPHSRETLAEMKHLANDYLFGAGRPQEAIPLLEEALRLMKEHFGPDDLETVEMMKSLAFAYRAADRHDDEVVLWEQRLKLLKAKFGQENRDDINLATMNLAQAYDRVDRVPQAVSLLEATLIQCDATPDGDPHITVWTMENLGRAYRKLKRREDALAMRQKCVEFARTNLGEDDADTLDTMRLLALMYCDLGRPLDAVPLLQEAVRLSKAKAGPNHPNTQSLMKPLARAFREAGDTAKAEAVAHELLASVRQAAEQGDIAAQVVVARIYADGVEGVGVMKDLSEALKWYRVAAEQGDVEAQNALAWLLATCNDPKVRDGRNAIQFGEKAVAATNRKKHGALDTLAAAYAEAGDFAKAVSIQREAIALVPDGKRKEECKSRLKLYESGTPYHERE